MDKSWIRKSRLSKEYFDGVNDFLNFAFERSSQDGRILCPCLRCSNINWHTREIVEEHLICNGFLLGYTHWACHGESISSSSSSNTAYHLQDPSRLQVSTHDQIGSSRHDDMEGLLRDALRMHFEDLDNTSSQEDIPNMQNIRVESNEQCDIGPDRQESTVEPNTGASNFYKLLEDAKQELYPGCAKFSKLSFIVHLLHLKCLNGWSSKSFTMLLELLNDAFPSGTTLPKSTYDAKKFIKDLGLGYEKINSCPNDCMLYWGDKSNEQSCDVCGASRWVPIASENTNNDDMGGLGLIPSESSLCCDHSESTEDVQKLREEVEENKKMVSQLQSQLAAVIEFIRQKIPDCNLGGSCQDPGTSATCYTSAASNPSNDS